ncbi:MAG: hypothetical protein MUO38_01545, partial [Anaerolineales bacterium]|nr:hypothetical protein [Anaerolineales bacterium]
PERGKEEANDYRYFPEPDLPPLAVDPAWLERIRASLPELPDARRDRFVTAYALSPASAASLTADRAVADYFEATAAAAPTIAPQKIAHWVTGELFALLNQAGKEIQDCRATPSALAELVGLVESGQVSAASGKEILAVAFRSGESLAPAPAGAPSPFDDKRQPVGGSLGGMGQCPRLGIGRGFGRRGGCRRIAGRAGASGGGCGGHGAHLECIGGELACVARGRGRS